MKGVADLVRPLLTACLLCVVATFAHAQGADGGKRVALVIGNGAYKSVPQLVNPPNDAADMGASLVVIANALRLLRE